MVVSLGITITSNNILKPKGHIIFLFLLIGTLFSCQGQWTTPTNNFLAKKGELNLKSWDIEKDGIIDLDGEWAFYWDELFTTAKDVNPTEFVNVPSFWDNYPSNSKKSSYGYATYQLKIILPSERPKLAFKMLSFGTAYEMYVNGQKIAQSGEVGKDEKSTKPYTLPLVVQFENTSDTLEISIQVANFHHRNGGFWHSIQFGESKRIQISRDRLIAIDLLLVGCLLIMAFYHLGIYAFRKQDRSVLYFSIVSLLFVVHTLITDERYLLYLFPEIPWELAIRAEYLTVYLGFSFYIMFFCSVYPKEFSRKVMLAVRWIGFTFAAFVLLTPVSIFSYSLNVMQVLMLSVGIYVFYALILAVSKQREAAKVFLLGFVIFAGTLVNDLLYTAHILNTGRWISLGFLIFTFTQAIVLSIRYARSFTAIEDFTADLEDRVEKRTQEISLKNIELQNQKDEIIRKTAIIEKKNKNITASINYASRIQKAIIGNEDAVSSNFKESFILIKPKDIVSGDFYWYTEVKRLGTIKGTDDRQSIYFKIIAAADCTGHGIPGAFMTVMGNALLDEIINENKVTNPSRILSVLDRKLLMKLRQHNVNDGMDIAMLIFDDENHIVTFAGANNPLYYVRDGEMHQVRGAKFPIGSTQYKTKKKFESHSIDYLPGDTFYIFTDGFQDQFGGEEGRKYYKKSFRELLLRISSLPMKEQKIILEEELMQWQGDQAQTDDILVIGIKT